MSAIKWHNRLFVAAGLSQAHADIADLRDVLGTHSKHSRGKTQPKGLRRHKKQARKRSKAQRRVNRTRAWAKRRNKRRSGSSRARQRRAAQSRIKVVVTGYRWC